MSLLYSANQLALLQNSAKNHSKRPYRHDIYMRASDADYLVTRIYEELTALDAAITGSNELTEILAVGNTTGAFDIIVTAGQKITVDTLLETTADAGILIDGARIKDGGLIIPAQAGAGGPTSAISSVNAGKTLIHLDDAAGNGYFEVTLDNYGFVEPYVWMVDETGAGGAGSQVLDLYIKAGYAAVSGVTGDIAHFNDLAGVQSFKIVPNGVVAEPSLRVGTEDDGFYRVGVNQLGVSINDSLATMFVNDGVKTDSVQSRIALGTPGASVTAKEYGDGKSYTVELTLVTAAIGTVAGGADEAIGAAVYTLPAGEHAVKIASMNVQLNGPAAIQADTPDVGVGTTVGSGANALLSAVGAGAENIITGQTAADVNGTSTVKTVVDQHLAIATADSHIIYLNAADGWAAGGGAVTATGTIVIEVTMI